MGQKRITINDVASRAGVSRATAARAFSNPELLSSKTLKRVQQAADTLSFTPNLVARQLRTQTTHLLGVVLPSLRNPVFAELLHHLQLRAREHGYTLAIATTEYDHDSEQSIIAELLSRQVDGLILTVADAANSNTLQQLDTDNVPYVLVYNQSPHSHHLTFGVDNRAAMHEATAQLIHLGHRNIAMVAGIRIQSDRAHWRYQGYVDAMHAAGLEPQPLIEMPSHTRTDADVLLPHLTGQNRLTALLASNDLLALNTMRMVRDAGFSIPDDISIIGFDGIDIGRFSQPELTTIEQPAQDIAFASVDTLLSLLRGEPAGSRQLAHQLRSGGSICHAPPNTPTTHQEQS